MADLRTSICGIQFPNPIWTAAGPASADSQMMLRAAQGGAGGLVSKTISASRARVPIPNISSPSLGSLLNAELWSELDFREFIARELTATRSCGLPLVVSVGYSPEELREVGREIERAGVADAIEFSIHYVDKNPENLRKLAGALKDVVSVPVWAKLSPAVQDLEGFVSALDDLVDGYVAVNSVGPTLDFDPVTLRPYMGSNDGRGWLSGRAIFPIGLHFVATISKLSRKPLIGVGGVRDAVDAAKYILAGASAVQVCSQAILKGQNVYGKIASGLSLWMDKQGYADIESMRGAFHRRDLKPSAFLGETTLLPDITYDKCTYCELCVKGCVHEALRFESKRFVVDDAKCVSCGLCATLCPTSALTMVAV